MRGVAIVAPVRTAVATFGGGLRGVSAADLASLVIKESVERSGIDPAKLDDVILGCGYPSGENPAIGRLAGLKADLPIEVPGYQLDRRCSSGLQAILNAAMLVQTENADAVVAGGVESMSNAEYYVNEARWGGRFGSQTFHDRLVRARETISPEERFGYISGMVETAENLAKQYEIARQEQDEYALRSHQRAVAAQEAGKFDQENRRRAHSPTAGRPRGLCKRRESPGRHQHGGPGPLAPGDARRHRHRRQRQQPERRRLGVPGGGRGQGGRAGCDPHGLPARLGCHRLPPRLHGHRPRPLGQQGNGQDRYVPGGHGPD